MNKLLLLTIPLLLMGCLVENQTCVNGNCANTSINTTLELPETNLSQNITEFVPLPTLKLTNDENLIQLGESTNFQLNLDFNSNEFAYAEISTIDNNKTSEPLNVSNTDKTIFFEYAFAGKKTGNYEIAFQTIVHYKNNSVFDTLYDSFHIQVKPIKYYHDEKENTSINKAAQSFTINTPIKINRVLVYGAGTPKISLCRSDAGKPVEYDCVTADTTSNDLEHFIEVNATLSKGKHWVVVEDFEWFTDLYGEYDSNTLIFENKKWLPNEKNFYFEVSN